MQPLHNVPTTCRSPHPSPKDAYATTQHFTGACGYRHARRVTRRVSRRFAARSASRAALAAAGARQQAHSKAQQVVVGQQQQHALRQALVGERGAGRGRWGGGMRGGARRAQPLADRLVQPLREAPAADKALEQLLRSAARQPVVLHIWWNIG